MHLTDAYLSSMYVFIMTWIWFSSLSGTSSWLGAPSVVTTWARWNKDGDSWNRTKTETPTCLPQTEDLQWELPISVHQTLTSTPPPAVFCWAWKQTHRNRIFFFLMTSRDFIFIVHVLLMWENKSGSWSPPCRGINHSEIPYLYLVSIVSICV